MQSKSASLPELCRRCPIYGRVSSIRPTATITGSAPASGWNFSSTHPDDWQRYRVESLLSASPAGEKKYDEAEPPLPEGYQGMLASKDLIDVRDRYHFQLAHQWLVQVYQAWGKPGAVHATGFMASEIAVECTGAKFQWGRASEFVVFKLCGCSF